GEGGGVLRAGRGPARGAPRGLARAWLRTTNRGGPGGRARVAAALPAGCAGGGGSRLRPAGTAETGRCAMRRIRAIALLVLLALLAACSGGGPLVKPGPNAVGSRLSIDAGMEWTRMA